VSRIFRAFGLAERRPALGSRGDGTSHLLVLQQLDVEISLRRPRRAGDVAQPRSGEVERRLTVRKRAHDTGALEILEPVTARHRLYFCGPDAAHRHRERPET
jgi:hypothetical protein